MGAALRSSTGVLARFGTALSLLLVGGGCSLISSPQSADSPNQTSTSSTTSIQTTEPIESVDSTLPDQRPASYPIVPLPGCGGVDLVHGNIAISQDRWVPGGDFDSLRDLAGLPNSLAVVEGTVVSHSGPSMVPMRNGYTDYLDATGPPEVQLTDLTVITELFDRDSGESFRAIRALVDQNEITLRHTAGYLETGGRYAVFLGLWGVGEFSMLYAHDLATDLPAHGFLSEASSRMLGKMETFRPEGCNLDRLIDLATDARLVEDGGQDSGLFTFVFEGSEPVSEDVMQQNFNSTDIPGQFSGESDELIIVEILILADEPGVYTLRGEKDFGRAPINENGSTVILGFVPPGTKFESIVFTGGDGQSHEIELEDIGLEPDAMILNPDGIYGNVSAVLDLTEARVTEGLAGDTRFSRMPLPAFFEAVQELSR